MDHRVGLRNFLCGLKINSNYCAKRVASCEIHIGSWPIPFLQKNNPGLTSCWQRRGRFDRLGNQTYISRTRSEQVNCPQPTSPIIAPKQRLGAGLVVHRSAAGFTQGAFKVYQMYQRTSSKFNKELCF